MINQIKRIVKSVPFAVPVCRRLKLLLKALKARPAQLMTKEQFARNAQSELNNFLESAERLTFKDSSTPTVSIVIPVYNKAEFTYRCLKNLLRSAVQELEIIIIDNASVDKTQQLLAKVDNVRIISNQQNLHFLKASNQGARAATAEYVLFLNNDAEPEPEAIKNALTFFKIYPRTGAVGAKLILPHGKLQEAGSVVWNNAGCHACLRDQDPDCAEAQFARVVDYCSGAFLLTSKKLLEEFNYFDEMFAPAYYEEVDYCLTLQSAGYQVWYNPESVVRHFEYGSSDSSAEPVRLMLERQGFIQQKHRKLLESKYEPDPKNLLMARDLRRFSSRVLYIDERLPQIKTGAGYPRANSLVRALLSEGAGVTICPLIHVAEDETWEQAYSDIPREIEISSIKETGMPALKKLLEQRKLFYDTVWISRPTTMEAIKKVSPDLSVFGSARLIYDAEAIFSMRDIHYRRLQGEQISDQQVNQIIRQETELAKGVHAISSVSIAEAEYYKEVGYEQVEVVGFLHQNTISTKFFAERKDLLFVGAIHADHTPNSDSVFYFVKEILPLLQQQGFKDQFYVVGTNHAPGIQALAGPQVKIIGAVPDLKPWFDNARVFVAATRFAAGIPHKITEASSHGLPCVVSKLLDSQLLWEDSVDYLSAATKEEFAAKIMQLYTDSELWSRIQVAAYQRIGKDYSYETFTEGIRKLLH